MITIRESKLTAFKTIQHQQSCGTCGKAHNKADTGATALGFVVSAAA